MRRTILASPHCKFLGVSFKALWEIQLQQGHTEKIRKLINRLSALGNKIGGKWEVWPDGIGRTFAQLVADRIGNRIESVAVPENLRDATRAEQ